MKNAHHVLRRDLQRGFTLVEVMVAMSLGLMVIAMALGSFIAISKSAASSVNASSIHASLRLGLDRVTADLIPASNIISCVSDLSISFNAVTSSVTSATSQVNTVSSEVRLFRYDPVGRVLYSRKAGGAERSILDGVDAVLFSMFDSAGEPTDQPAEAFVIGIQIDASGRASGRTYSDRVYSRVLLRNRR